jgi:hypothetical protein
MMNVLLELYFKLPHDSSFGIFSKIMTNIYNFNTLSYQHIPQAFPYSKEKIDTNELDRNIGIWGNIDQSYINYMRKIGIYK